MAKKSAQPIKKLKITLVRSSIGYSKRHKATVRALGLRRMNQMTVQTDTPVVRGMLAKIGHLVKVEEQVE
jgi:large subunit ribosomal protein L30